MMKMAQALSSKIKATLTPALLNGMALALPIVLGACATFRGAPPPPIDATAEATDLESLHNAGAIKGCLEKPIDQQRGCRDTIVQSRMVVIDAHYREFRHWFYGEARWGGFGATVTSLALTGTASLSGVPQSTARILSMVATGVTGIRAAYDKEILADRAATAVENSMDAGRAQAAVRIRSGLTQTAEKYPTAVALSDLEEYYSAGTLLGAFTNIGTLTGVQAANANNELTVLARDGVLTTASSWRQILSWLRPNGTLDTKRRDRLQDWLNANAVDASGKKLPWGQLGDDRSGAGEELRQRAIKYFEIPGG
jgi:hypothetical protein